MGSLLSSHSSMLFSPSTSPHLPPPFFPQRMKDVGRLLLRIKKVKAAAGDWLGLQQSLLAAHSIKELLLLMMPSANAAIASQNNSNNNGSSGTAGYSAGAVGEAAMPAMLQDVSRGGVGLDWEMQGDGMQRSVFK